jgi:hypothetical protein
METCDPPARETESPTFGTLSRPPEKNQNLPTFQNFRKIFFLQKILKIYSELSGSDHLTTEC